MMLKDFLKRLDEYQMLFGLWLSGFIPFIFRPLKFWWAERMILACGYEDKNGAVVIIYRPAVKTSDYELVVSNSSRRLFWRWSASSRQTVHQVLLTGGRGAMFVVRLGRSGDDRFFIRAKGPLRRVYSRTVDRRRLATVFGASNFRSALGPPLQFFWRQPPDRDFWFSFLTIEDSRRALVSGVYTRQESWVFPETENLPYYVHHPPAAILEPGQTYHAVLYAVNRFNWVTHLDVLTFSL